MKKVVVFLLRGIARLPFPVLYGISDFIYFIVYHIVKYRIDIVRKNIGSAFPEKSEDELKKIEKTFYKYLGDQIMETVKMFHLSDKELKKRVKVLQAEDVNATFSSGRNAVVLMGHYANWEWVQEIVNYFIPGIFMASIYHPLKDKFWDKVFIDLRSRWHAHIVPMKSAPRILLNRQNFPWVCGFIADQRPGQRTLENIVEFLHHNTYFIYGPEVIGDKVKADYFYLENLRTSRGHYQLTFKKLHPANLSDTYPYTREFWREFEKTIEKAPAYWLWSHNRWK